MLTREQKLRFTAEILSVVVIGLGVWIFLIYQKTSHLEATEKPLQDIQSMQMDMSSMGSMEQMAGMSATTYNVLAGQPVPTVSFQIIPDKADGYDIHTITTNFTFTPEKIGSAAVPNEGHIHLYVDGALIVVLSPWYHLNNLPSGNHQIEVVLANNDHSQYQVNGQQVQAVQTLHVK
jgi:hypothetical protein